MEPFLQEPNQKIQNALAHLKHELGTIRAGRANPTLIEDVPVMAYGSRMKLMEVATISSPQPTLLTVSVWDASLLNDVQKAILEANLGLTPNVDGQTIRIGIPPLTEERRAEFIKMAHQRGETAKVEIRQIRQHARDELEKQPEAEGFGDDELERRQKILQDVIDSAIGSIDLMISVKEEDLKQI